MYINHKINTYFTIYSGIIGKKFIKYTDRIKLNILKRRKLYTNQNQKSRKKCVGVQSASGPDDHYGLAEPLVDLLDENELEEEKKQFIYNLKAADLNKIEI